MKHIGLIVKILVLISIIMLGVFAWINCSGGSCVKKIDKTMPTVAEAPYPVYTTTHLYYARLAKVNTDKSVTMTDWYESIKGKWVFHKNDITIPERLRPWIGEKRTVTTEQ